MPAGNTHVTLESYGNGRRLFFLTLANYDDAHRGGACLAGCIRRAYPAVQKGRGTEYFVAMGIHRGANATRARQMRWPRSARWREHYHVASGCTIESFGTITGLCQVREFGAVDFSKLVPSNATIQSTSQAGMGYLCRIDLARRVG